RQVVAEVDGALALAQHRQAQPSGHLRVSMPGDIAMLALSGMIERFVREHPAVTLELDLSPRRVDLIAENYDLALRMGDPPAGALLRAARLGGIGGGRFLRGGWVGGRGLRATPGEWVGPGRHWRALTIAGQAGEPTPWRLERQAPDGGEPARWQGLPATR